MSGGRIAPAWTDTHCHVHGSDDAAGELRRAAAAGVVAAVCVGTSEESSQRAVELVAAHRSAGLPRLAATIGQHPHDAAAGVDALVSYVERILAGADSDVVVAIGECGLDYYYEHSPRVEQRESFAAQIELARRNELALVVHTRDAWGETIEVLRSEGVPPRTVIHCFSGGPDEARACLELGAYLSFSGIVTFKNADEIRAAASLCPLDRMLVETDAPYLAPVPHRGKANEPAFVALVGEGVAALRGIDPSELAAITTENARAVFGFA